MVPPTALSPLAARKQPALGHGPAAACTSQAARCLFEPGCKLLICGFGTAARGAGLPEVLTPEHVHRG